MRLNARAVPWLLALLGLAIPLVGTGFMVWPLTAVWVVILALIRLVGRATLPRDRTLRMGYAAGLLPVLFLLGWEGGWWLIPADLAYLLIEARSSKEGLADPRRSVPGPEAGDIPAP